MKYPTLIVDNFFDNPDEIRDYSDNCDWFRSDRVIGHTTKDLSSKSEHQNFFHFVGHKVLSLIQPYDTHKIIYNAGLYFQKQITGKSHLDGWVHKDDAAEMTAIIYLNKKDTFGTNIYNRKNQWSSGVSSLSGSVGDNIKHNGFKNAENDNFDEESFLIEKKKNNQYYNPVIEVSGLYNRILMMDSSQYHALQLPSPEKNNEERLILMMFFYSLQMPGLKDGVIESRRFRS